MSGQTKAMVLIVCAIATFGFVLRTVSQPKEGKQWVIEIRTPANVLAETWRVQSIGKPMVEYTWSDGRVIDLEGDWQWERSIRVPAGWRIVVRESNSSDRVKQLSGNSG